MDILESIAKIHKAQLKNTDVLSSCGVRIIKEFYKTVSALDSTILLTEQFDAKVTGFVYCCTGEQSPISGFLKVNFLRIITSPIAIVQILKSILNRLIFKNKYLWSNELVYIAVDKKYAGRGIATKLIQLLEEELTKREIPEYYLQVYSRNTAVHLYKKLNFQTVGIIKRLDENKYLMKKILN